MLLATLLALLAVTPAALASWTQPGGDASHSGATKLPAPLDVVQVLKLVPEGLTLQSGGLGVAAAGDQLVLLAKSGANCVVVRIDAAGAPQAGGGGQACPNGGRLVAVDEGRGIALACIAATSGPILFALPLGGGAAKWSTAPLLQDTLAGLPIPAIDLAGTERWDCDGAAVDGGTAYLPFWSQLGRNRVQAVNLDDGTVRWATSVPGIAFTQPEGVDLSILPGSLTDLSQPYQPKAATLTEDGVVVVGPLQSDDNAGVAPTPGAAWLDLEGVLQGVTKPAVDPDAPTAVLPASIRATSQEKEAALVLGSRVVVIDPAKKTSASFIIQSPSVSATQLAAPVWGRDALFLPTETGAFVPNDNFLEFTPWGGYRGGRVSDVLIGTNAAWVAVTVEDQNGSHADLLRVGLLDVQNQVRIPLPLHPTGGLGAHLLPWRDGLFVWDDIGNAAFLQQTARQPTPTLALDTPYPAATTPASITVGRPGGAGDDVTMLLAWGDGKLEGAKSGSTSHTYAEAGERIVTVTAVYPDGTTASRQEIMHVGTLPEAPKGILEVLFSADNQNYTFFGIGIIMSAIASVIAAWGVHRGRHRLERHLKRLEGIRDAGRREPFKAIRDLHDFRVAERTALRKGELDDPQYTIVESGAAEVLQLLRQRILGNYTGRVSDRFSRSLDTALADGAIDPDEADSLMEQAHQEPELDKQERDRLSNLVKGWAKAI